MVSTYPTTSIDTSQSSGVAPGPKIGEMIRKLSTRTNDPVARSAAAKELTQFDPADVKIYLATAGLLMADQWRDATWPVVDSLEL